MFRLPKFFFFPSITSTRIELESAADSITGTEESSENLINSHLEPFHRVTLRTTHKKYYTICSLDTFVQQM